MELKIAAVCACVIVVELLPVSVVFGMMLWNEWREEHS